LPWVLFFVDLKLFSEIEELFGVCVLDHQKFKSNIQDSNQKIQKSFYEKQQTIFFEILIDFRKLDLI
jgi:hypothetical protein